MSVSEKTSRTRGRPRSFDKVDALKAASAVFQRKGYDATSLDDLAKATGLTRPSLYAAFGNKDDLYLQALKHVTRDMAGELGALTRSDFSLETALRSFYRAALERYLEGPAGPCGCIVMTTGVVRAGGDEAVKAFVLEVLTGLDVAIDRVYAAHFTGSEDERRRKCALAVAMLQSLSIRARAGEDRASLEALIALALPALI